MLTFLEPGVQEKTRKGYIPQPSEPVSVYRAYHHGRSHHNALRSVQVSVYETLTHQDLWIVWEESVF